MLGNPELERALLEQTYDGVMTVTGTSKQEVGGETVVTPDAVLHENIPCALSFSGCRIAVQQYGTTYRLKYSGESAVYPTHQQLSAVREERA